MKMLAIDFSAEPRGVALLERLADGTVRVAAWMEAVSQSAVGGLQLVESALRRAGWDRSDVGALAVGLGPGSYTGIRMALAMAQGWHLACGVAVSGANSMDSMAARAWEVGVRGRVRVVVDAQRRELYVAGYELRDTGWDRVEELHLATVESLHQLPDRTAWQWLGPEVTRWFADGRVLGPSAVHVGRLALAANPAPPEGLEPIYLRPTQFVKAPTPRFTEP